MIVVAQAAITAASSASICIALPALFPPLLVCFALGIKEKIIIKKAWAGGPESIRTSMTDNVERVDLPSSGVPWGVRARGRKDYCLNQLFRNGRSRHRILRERAETPHSAGGRPINDIFKRCNI